MTEVIDEHATPEDGAAGLEATWRTRAVERSLRAARAKAESRSERFIQSAIEMLSETGRADFTVQELVERSKTSLRSFYQHFNSKDELLLALMEEVMWQSVDHWRSEVEDLPSMEGLHVVVLKVHGRTLNAKGLTINRALSSFNLHLAESKPEEFARVLSPLNELVKDLVDKGVAEGTVRSDIEAGALTEVFVETLVGAAQLNALGNLSGALPAGTDLVWKFFEAAVRHPGA